jgi:hypothetical protein
MLTSSSSQSLGKVGAITHRPLSHTVEVLEGAVIQEQSTDNAIVQQESHGGVRQGAAGAPITLEMRIVRGDILVPRVRPLQSTASLKDPKEVQETQGEWTWDLDAEKSWEKPQIANIPKNI